MSQSSAAHALIPLDEIALLRDEVVAELLVSPIKKSLPLDRDLQLPDGQQKLVCCFHSEWTHG